jgi:hypothetical protein
MWPSSTAISLRGVRLLVNAGGQSAGVAAPPTLEDERITAGAVGTRRIHAYTREQRPPFERITTPGKVRAADEVRIRRNAAVKQGGLRIFCLPHHQR